MTQQSTRLSTGKLIITISENTIADSTPGIPCVMDPCNLSTHCRLGEDAKGNQLQSVKGVSLRDVAATPLQSVNGVHYVYNTTGSPICTMHVYGKIWHHPQNQK